MDIDLLNEVRILDLAARILNICAEYWLPGYCRCRFFDCPNIKYAVLFQLHGYYMRLLTDRILNLRFFAALVFNMRGLGCQDSKFAGF